MRTQRYDKRKICTTRSFLTYYFAGERITFLFTEGEIKDESFLEVINSILTTGEVPNLIPKDELVIMASELRPLAGKYLTLISVFSMKHITFNGNS